MPTSPVSSNASKRAIGRPRETRAGRESWTCGGDRSGCQNPAPSHPLGSNQLSTEREGHRKRRSDDEDQRLAALLYAALLAHLLFIPYAFTPLSFDEALHRLAAMRWVQLGSDQNVALVSRGLMFLPLGLLAAWVTPQPRRRIELPALLTSGLIGCLWAVGLNLAQFWFPARTVSLNNLVAESIGVVSGGLLWSALGAQWLRWRQQLFSGGGVSISAALSGYVILYLIAILTPFDFVTSSAELSENVASNLYALWVAPVGCGPAPCKLKFLATLLAAVPCGWWFAARRRGKGNAWVLAVPVALIVATIVELLHFLMVSGVSQGASVFLRASGMVIGAATYPLRRHLAAMISTESDCRLLSYLWGSTSALWPMSPGGFAHRKSASRLA